MVTIWARTCIQTSRNESTITPVTTIGVDIGGSKVAGVLLDDSGIVTRSVWHQHQGGVVDVVTLIADVVAELSRNEQSPSPTSVGVSIAAWLTVDRLGVTMAANLGLGPEPLTEQLRARLGLPVVLENDGNATAWAEYVRGSGRGARTLVCLALGTGVGGGIVSSGKLVVGGNGLAGELGHLQVETDGAACVCGGSGCLELYASGRAVAGAAASAVDVVIAARAGDAAAVNILALAGRMLGRAIARVVPIVDPDIVLVTGSLAEAARELIIDSAQAELRRCAPLTTVREPVSIRLGSCGRDAAAVGVAELARVALAPIDRHYQERERVGHG
jgi:glucokinase